MSAQIKRNLPGNHQPKKAKLRRVDLNPLERRVKQKKAKQNHQKKNQVCQKRKKIHQLNNLKNQL
jgi:hypothetical protein